MLLTNSLLHALLVADDQSYNRSATPDEALAPFTDGDTVNLMPGGWQDDLTGWKVARRFDDPDTGFGAVVYRKPNGDGSKFDYIVALQGTRGPNAQDWHGNLTYGWEKFAGTQGQQLMNYLTEPDGILSTTNNIHFTGQSLGGALSQYVAYRYVDRRIQLGSPINPDNMSLTTFNGLGGMQALEQNYKNTFHSGDAGYVFNKGLLAGVATRHYWITNDIVSRLVPNLNGAGNEYRLDFHQNAIGSGPAQAIPDAHRIESGFYRGFSKFGVDFDRAVQLGITHLDIGDVAKIGTAWANIFNNARTGDGEAAARLISALMLGVAYGPVEQVEALTNAALEHLHADGTLDDAAYAFAREHTTELIRGIAQSPAGIATQARAWLLANILNLTETTDTSSLADSASYAQAVAFTDGAFATYSTELENPDRQALGDLDTILRKALGLETSTLSLKAVVAAAVILGPTAFEAAATPVPTLQSIVANSGVQAQMLEALKNTPDAVGAFLKSLALGAIAAGQDVGKAIAEAASWLYEEAIQTAKGVGTAAVDLVSEITDAVEDIFRSAGNAAGDFINKYSDAAVAWAAGLNDTLRKQLIDGFGDVWRGEGGQFGGAGATGSWDEFANGMAYAVSLGETADQKIILRPGSGPNPFDAAGGPGDVNAAAPASINEKGTGTFTIYLPYEAGKDGQRIRLQLAGTAASAFDVVATSGAYPVGPEGSFDLFIHEGQKQFTFVLSAARDVDVSETLELNATLMGANNSPTHATHLELDLALTAIEEPTPPQQSALAGTDASEIIDMFVLAPGIPVTQPVELQGGGGADYILRRNAGDVVVGGNGNDWITGWDEADNTTATQTVDGGLGNDLISSLGGKGTFRGGAGNDFITGTTHWDWTGGQIPLPGVGSTLTNPLNWRFVLWPAIGAVFSPDFKRAQYQTTNGSFNVTNPGSWQQDAQGNFTLAAGPGLVAGTGTLGGDPAKTWVYRPGESLDLYFNGEIRERWEIYQDIQQVEDQKALSIDGGDGDDALVGAFDKDVIVGGAGGDLIQAGSGDDTVYGDIASEASPTNEPDGDDQIALGAGDDYAQGGGGNDVIWAGIGADTVFGGIGNDVLYGDGMVAGPGGNDYLDGGDGDDLLYGAAGSDTLSGGSGSDVLHGDHAYNAAEQMGDDVLDGAAGTDELWGYGGNDQLSGGADDDLLVGGTGDDKLDGGSGADELWGEEGTDTLTGGGGDDFLDGDAGADRLYGGDGDDEMWGEQNDVSVAASGDDVIYGEAGNDSIVGGAGNDTLDGGADNDGQWGGVGNDTLTGGAGDDGLYGEDSDDTLSGGTGGDTLNGGDGADTLQGGEGADYLEGGAGADTYVFNPGDGARNAQGQAEAVIETGSDTTFVFGGGITRQNVTARKVGTTNNLSVSYGSVDAFLVTNGMSLGGATFRFSDGTTATLDDMLNAGLDGGSGNDSIIGHSGRNNVIHGGDGNDLISGQSGDDILYGDDGADRLSAGNGNDVLYGGAGNDELTGGGGNDVLDGGAGNDGLISGSGSYTIVFGRGYGCDYFTNSAAIPSVADNVVELAQGVSASDISVRRAQDGSLVLTINGTTDKLTIDKYFYQAMGGPIPIRFFDGTTWDIGTVIAHTQLPTPGDDFLAGFETTVTIDGGDGNDIIYGSAFANHLSGGSGADELYGGPRIDVLLGGAGNDNLNAGDGNDSLDGGEGDDLLTGHAGNDLLLGGAGNDALDGSEGDDNLSGGGGFDVLVGGDGADTLDGGEYQDVMSGGQGADTYLFGRGAGQDTIYNGQDYYAYPPFDSPYFFYDFDPLGVNPDTIQIGADLAPSDITVQRTGNDLVLGIVGTTDTLTVHYYFAAAATTSSAVEQVRFANGVVWSPDDLKAAVTRGTAGNDYLEGFSTGDTISGGDGSDTIRGLQGDDVLDGGNGTDSLDGGDGNDSLFGGGDNDFLEGGAGDDGLHGGAGNDYLTGGPGHDAYLFGRGAGQDTINNYHFDNAADSIQIDAGVAPSDISLSRVGSDLVISIKGTSDTLRCTQYFSEGGLPAYPLDVIRFADATAWDQTAVAARMLPMNLIGTNSDDVLTGGELNDTLIGLAGNDRLDGGLGGDQLNGGSGDDTYVVDTSGYFLSWTAEGNHLAPASGSFPVGPWDTVVENPGDGVDTVQSSVSYLLGASIENLILTGSSYAAGMGNDLANDMTGNTGDNVLFGGLGADTMRGGFGNDGYVVDDADDLVIENVDEGSDHVFSEISYALGANVETLFLIGSANNSGSGNDLDNWISGNSGANVLIGGAGDDWLVGDQALDGNAASVDTLDGGIGNDFYYIPRTSSCTTLVASTDPTPGKVDTLFLEFDPLATTVERAGLDLKFSFAGSTAIVIVKNYFATVGGTLIERFEFADETAWTPADIASKLPAATEGDDHIVGTAANDTISALGGNDVVDAGEGNDTIDGGSGDDLLNGQNGLDNLIGGTGNDTLDGGTGADAMAGGLGNDTYIVDATADAITENAAEGSDLVRSSMTYSLTANVENLTLTGTASINGTGNALDNVLTGNGASNALAGGAGNDTLDGGAGNDTLVGGLGDDIFIVDNAADVVTENAAEGTDTVRSSVTLALANNVENLVLTGTAAIDGTGNTLNNVLTGNAAANVLIGGAGTDTLIGGAGDDTYVVDATGDVVTENAGGGTDRVQSGVTYTLSANVENLMLTGITAINGTGNTLDNVLIGNSANNTLTGNDGNDTLDGGAGTDTMVGGLGNDTYTVDVSTDVVTEAASAGTDTVRSSVTLTVAANVENLTLTGTSAINGTGNTLNNLLTGNAANNVLDGGTGADTLIGGAGNDTYVVDVAGDVVTENASEGADLVQSAATCTLSANVENLTLTGTSAINGTGNSLDNVLIGNSANNTLTGGDGNDTLDGGAGNDTMVGGLGNDTYVVNISTDVVTEADSGGTDLVQSAVTYTIGANVENLTLTGTSAINGTGNTLDNVLIGNSANNTLTGSDGNDTLDGGAGTDTMVGGLGNDTYTVNVSTDVVTEATSAGTDTVLSSVTLTLATNAENLILTGTTAINGTGNTLANLVRGNAAVNTLNGGTGNDLLEGADGSDILTDSSGKAWFNGGAGTDTITGGTAAEIFVGGLGNDTINTSSGADIILVNKGDGSDIVNGGTGTDNVVSLGGGIRYADLKFRKATNDLILDVSATESITFKNWYVTTANNKSVAKLQLILDATAEYNAASTDPTLNKKVEQFDFAGLATKFDQALVVTPTLTSWALTNALSTYYLTGSSDTAALGGDLAYYYGKNGNVAGMTTTAAQDVIGSASLGTANQSLRAFSGISGGANVLL